MESSCYEQVYVALASAASGSFSEEQCQALKDLHMLIDNYATSPYRGVLVGCLIQIIVTQMSMEKAQLDEVQRII